MADDPHSGPGRLSWRPNGPPSRVRVIPEERRVQRAYEYHYEGRPTWCLGAILIEVDEKTGVRSRMRVDCNGEREGRTGLCWSCGMREADNRQMLKSKTKFAESHKNGKKLTAWEGR